MCVCKLTTKRLGGKLETANYVSEGGFYCSVFGFQGITDIAFNGGVFVLNFTITFFQSLVSLKEYKN